jgi:hypothetical protein
MPDTLDVRRSARAPIGQKGQRRCQRSPCRWYSPPMHGQERRRPITTRSSATGINASEAHKGYAGEPVYSQPAT